MTDNTPQRPSFTPGGASGNSYGQAPWPPPQAPQQPAPRQQPVMPIPGSQQPIMTQPQPVPPAQKRARFGAAALVTVALLGAGLGGGVGAVANHYLTAQRSHTATDTANGNSTTVVQASADNPNWATTAEAVKDAVVAIQVSGNAGNGQGSGVIIDTEGNIVTNNHVVSGGGEGAKIAVGIGSQSYLAKIVGTDPTTDLAVIKLTNPPSNLKTIDWGDASTLKVGQNVMAIGNPLGLSDTVTTGIISALNRPVTTEAIDPQTGQSNQRDSSNGNVVTSAIQTNAAINPGNSGGALVDASGKLIGITSSIASLTSSASGSQSGNIGIGFAIPVNQAKSVAEQLIKDGSAQHAKLGVTAQDGESGTQLGAKIKTVASGSPAEQAGLKSDDLITAVGDTPVTNSESLIALIRNCEVGQEVTLKVLRGGTTEEIKVTLVAG